MRNHLQRVKLYFLISPLKNGDLPGNKPSLLGFGLSSGPIAVTPRRSCPFDGPFAGGMVYFHGVSGSFREGMSILGLEYVVLVRFILK